MRSSRYAVNFQAVKYHRYLISRSYQTYYDIQTTPFLRTNRARGTSKVLMPTMLPWALYHKNYYGRNLQFPR